MTCLSINAERQNCGSRSAGPISVPPKSSLVCARTEVFHPNRITNRLVRGLRRLCLTLWEPPSGTLEKMRIVVHPIPLLPCLGRNGDLDGVAGIDDANLLVLPVGHLAFRVDDEAIGAFPGFVGRRDGH